MSKYIFIISPRRIQKRDYERFGVRFLKKNKKVIILDVSNLLNNRSILLYKKFVNNDIIEINKYKDLILFLKNKKDSYAVDYLRNSFKEILIRFILAWFNINIIKYLGGLKPPVLFKHINKDNKVFKVDQRTLIKKIIDIPISLLTLIKKKIIILINSFVINTVIIAGKKLQNIDFNIKKVKKILYSHTYNYNSYIELKEKKKRKPNKDYIVYIDQNLISHPDFFIKKKNPYVDEKFYPKINNFLLLLKKKYGYDIKIALHPKNNLNKNLFPNKKNCFIDKTPELIKDCKHVIMHYSTAVSYGVLYEKPITFITTNHLNTNRPGALITKLAMELNSQLINIDRSNNFTIKRSFDKKKYNNYTNQYIKHPKSNGENSWIYLLKNIC
jgi:hypothetical protein